MLYANEYLLDPCLTENALSEAFRLRYTAYSNAGAIDKNPHAEFRDRYDLLENVRTCLVYERHIPVASIRACIYDTAQDFLQLPSFEAYRPEIEKEIGLHKKIIEVNRFVIHPYKVDSKLLFKVPFRFIILNVLKTGVEYCIIAVRTRHTPLYKRFFRMQVISDPRKYPGLKVDMVLMAVECSAILPALMEMEEYFRITEEEIEAYPSFRKAGELQLY
jgi:hypothetical protein